MREIRRVPLGITSPFLVGSLCRLRLPITTATRGPRRDTQGMNSLHSCWRPVFPRAITPHTLFVWSPVQSPTMALVPSAVPRSAPASIDNTAQEVMVLMVYYPRLTPWSLARGCVHSDTSVPHSPPISDRSTPTAPRSPSVTTLLDKLHRCVNLSLPADTHSPEFKRGTAVPGIA